MAWRSPRIADKLIDAFRVAPTSRPRVKLQARDAK
jgi:hypothetical protein